MTLSRIGLIERGLGAKPVSSMQGHAVHAADQQKLACAATAVIRSSDERTSSSKSSTSSRGFVLCVPRRSSRVTLSRWMKRGAPSGGALDFGFRRWSQPCESMRTRVRNASRWPPFGFQTSHEHAIIPGAAPHSIAVEFIVWNPRGHLIHTYLVRCERTDASFHPVATHIGSATLTGA